MPVPYLSSKDQREQFQAADPAPSAQHVEDIPATEDPVRLADLPSLFEAQENLSVLDRHPNFFILTSSYPGDELIPPRVTNVAFQKEERNGEVKEATMQTSPLQKNINAAKAILVVASVPAWLETIIVMIGLMASFAAHAINMFNFPRYELDEGTYMSSAWAILNGLVTPYAYGYGHPPLAWIQIAAWIKLTGGFFTFGNALNSGRLLMLFYALGSSLLVYLIVCRMSGSRASGLLALVLFSLSPLSIMYQRQVFLDNVGTFWLLLSLYLIFAGNSRLSCNIFSAISFGISLLSKEIFILFIPVMVYAIWLHTTKYQRKFALITFTYTVVAFGSCFVLMAILKGELFPYSWHLPWDYHPHLSMLDTLVQQTRRTQAEGRFIDSWYAWTHGDPLLMVLSVAATVFNLITGWWNRRQLLLSLLAISFWILLLRGGVMLSFYIIPMIPLIALNTAIAVHTLVDWIGKLVRFDVTLIQRVRVLLILGIIAVVVPYDLQDAGIIFTQHPTSAQTDAIVWVRNHVPRNDVVVINSYLYMDLREPDGEGVADGATYPYAHVYWNIAYDPELHGQLLQGNWDRIDYIVTDSEMLHDITTVGGPMLLINKALNHAILRTQFRADDHDKQIVISIYQVVHKQTPPSVYSSSLPCQPTCQAENIGSING